MRMASTFIVATRLVSTSVTIQRYQQVIGIVISNQLVGTWVRDVYMDSTIECKLLN